MVGANFSLFDIFSFFFFFCKEKTNMVNRYRVCPLRITVLDITSIIQKNNDNSRAQRWEFTTYNGFIFTLEVEIWR